MYRFARKSPFCAVYNGPIRKVPQVSHTLNRKKSGSTGLPVDRQLLPAIHSRDSVSRVLCDNLCAQVRN